MKKQVLYDIPPAAAWLYRAIQLHAWRGELPRIVKDVHYILLQQKRPFCCAGQTLNIITHARRMLGDLDLFRDTRKMVKEKIGQRDVPSIRDKVDFSSFSVKERKRIQEYQQWREMCVFMEALEVMAVLMQPSAIPRVGARVSYALKRVPIDIWKLVRDSLLHA
jgi:hypothetical protein